MIKVLHIIDHLGLGGAQTVVRGIFESQKNNKDIFIFSLRKKEIETKIGHKNVIIRDSYNKHSLKPIKELRNLIEKENIGIIHCHLFRSQFIGWLLKMRYFPKIKLIFHEHGEIFENNLVYNNFLRLCQKNIHLIIAVSKATNEELMRRSKIKSTKIKVLQNFIDLKKFKPRRKKANNSLFKIGFVGRLNRIKGCGYLIKSLPYLRFRNYEVLVAGDGPEKERLEKLCKKLKVLEKVKFLGYVKDTAKIYSKLDVCIIPSLKESFGISALEAQASGVPIICSDIGGLKELVKDKKTGLLFKTKDYKQLAEEISNILFNKDLRLKLVDNAHVQIEKYAINEYLKKLNYLIK